MRALIILLAITGCSLLPPPGKRPTTHSEGVTGVVVRINGPGTAFGTGAVVGPHTVATVEHVADMGESLTIAGRRAKIVRRIPAEGWETIVLLECGWEWDDEHIFDYPPAQTGADRGYVIWNRRGAQGLRPSFVQKGDSGSPILDEDGRLVGHVSAVTGLGSFMQVGLGSFYPRGVQLNRIVIER